MVLQTGKQIRFCPNCGTQHFDTLIEMKHVKCMCCNNTCRDEWRIKYDRVILKIDQQEQ
jgi:NADH pyrophosphatase NudC (nudix superfamily)